MTIGLVCIVFISGSKAQNWGEMQVIYWQNPPWPANFGYYSPSYCDAESLLYFDNCCQCIVGWPGMIFVSQFEGFEYDTRRWSDPVALPEPINIPDCRNVMPSINTTGDSLFFCSEREGGFGDLDIWLSIKSGQDWGEPVNLGSAVNTPAREEYPHYAASFGFIFFDRQDGPEQLSVYKSRSLGNDDWELAERLPEIINRPRYLVYGPYFDEWDSVLYFTDHFWQENIHYLKMSRYRNDEWQVPEPLPDNVNGFWFPNYCNEVTTENACLSQDRQLLFYDKWIWEPEICIDWTGYLFYSEATVGIRGESLAENANGQGIDVFPNPSNGVFSFAFSKLENPGMLKIYNIKGQLIDEFQLNTNDSYVLWDSTDRKNKKVASGVYFAVLEDGAHKISRQFVLLK